METPQIYGLLAQAAGKLGGIDKSELNKEQNFRFRSIEAITAAVRPIFGELGVAVVPIVETVEYQEVTSKGGTRGYRCLATVNYMFVAGSDGSAATARMVGEAVDYGDKSTSKAIQMAFKYALTEVLQIGSGDNDPDGQTVGDLAPPPPVETNANRALRLIVESGVPKGEARRLAKAAMETLGLTHPLSDEQVDELVWTVEKMHTAEQALFPDPEPKAEKESK